MKKTVKLETAKVELPHVNKKSTKKANFQTPFSHSTLETSETTHATKPLDFSLHLLFRRDQNNYSNLTS